MNQLSLKPFNLKDTSDKKETMTDTAPIKSFLQSLPEFATVEPAALDWLLEKSKIIEISEGEFLFKPGDGVDKLFIILAGSLDIYQEIPNGRQDLFLLEAGSISGQLPFSRSKGTNAFGRVIEDLRLLSLEKKHFVEMVNVSYSLTQALVAVMSDRIRNVSQSQFQDEKLKALGKISAGLAHELNNPASAMVRSAEILYKKLEETPENFKAVMQLNVTTAQTDRVNDLLFKKIEQQKSAPTDFSLLARQERIDDLTDWLEDHGVGEADDLAETFTDYNFTEADLEEVLEIMEKKEKLAPVLGWFDNRLSVESLTVEIKEASGRIAELVQSVKKYSHMDQGSGKTPTDLHEGLRTTLSILGHLIKQKKIKVDKLFADDFPKILANPGELNQIWTNLIVNAIDALPNGGQISIRTFRERDYLCINIEDNGPGIPEEILHRIWEPFFTTKAIGEGTGIGLDLVKKIVQRHRGNIRVQSEPGKTVFTVKFLT